MYAKSYLINNSIFPTGASFGLPTILCEIAEMTEHMTEAFMDIL